MYLPAHKAEWGFEGPILLERRTARNRIGLGIVSKRRVPVPHQDQALIQTKTPPSQTPRMNGPLTQTQAIQLYLTTSTPVPPFP